MIVITNGLHLALYFNDVPEVSTFLAGGKLKAASGSLLGESTVSSLDNYHADIAFISCSAINEQGVYMSDESQSFVKRKMIEQADSVILLCDSSKFNKADYFKLCNFSSVCTIITDKKPDEALLTIFTNHEIEVLF
jgi:DeoR/GlpR family transcriptional regulator of sugar metabolism